MKKLVIFNPAQRAALAEWWSDRGGVYYAVTLGILAFLIPGAGRMLPLLLAFMLAMVAVAVRDIIWWDR